MAAVRVTGTALAAASPVPVETRTPGREPPTVVTALGLTANDVDPHPRSPDTHRSHRPCHSHPPFGLAAVADAGRGCLTSSRGTCDVRFGDCAEETSIHAGGGPVPSLPFRAARRGDTMAVVDHVVVLVLENRSFDHMLGYLEHPSPAFDGLTDGSYTNPGWDGGPPIATSPTAKTVLPFGPDHGHDAVMEQLALTGSGAARHATNQGFVLSYERKGRGLSPPRFGGLLGPLLNLVVDGTATAATTGRGPLVMCCQPMSHVPVLSRLALEFAVCTRWFCSVPGETWPNRNFLHAATSDGETGNELRPYTNRTVFDLLDEHGVPWHVYHDDTPQVWAFPALWDTPERHANWYHLDDFVTHVATGELPAYSFLEPNHRPPVHTAEYAPLIGSASVSNSQHPENNLVSDAAYDGYGDELDNDFTRAEVLVATVYEALRANPAVFDRTMLLITYDEHGGP